MAREPSDFSKRVRQFLGGQKPTPSLLPGTHLTTNYAFRSIIAGNTLDPEPCKTFGEDLLYFFYGRPAYRVSQDTYVQLKWNLPIAFIVKPNCLKPIVRIFPFDSGAFKRGYYGGVFADRSKMRDFELEPDLESAAKVVSGFFGDNKTYYLGDTKIDLRFDDFDFELQGLHYLAKEAGAQNPGNTSGRDERASAIEIQIKEKISISNCLLGIVVPETILENELFQQAITKWNIKDEQILTYVPVCGPGSEAWVGQIYQQVKDLYQRLGHI